MTAAAKPLRSESLTTIVSRTPLENALRRFVRHRSAQVGFVILCFMVFIAIFAPVLAPYSPIEVLKDVKPRMNPCIHAFGCDVNQPEHIFGVDGNRRDMLSRVIFGSRLSLEIGIATVSNMRNARRTSATATSCGVVTNTAP